LSKIFLLEKLANNHRKFLIFSDIFPPVFDKSTDPVQYLKISDPNPGRYWRPNNCGSGRIQIWNTEFHTNKFNKQLMTFFFKSAVQFKGEMLSNTDAGSLTHIRILKNEADQ
jgi:hypothetical protein